MVLRPVRAGAPSSRSSAAAALASAAAPSRSNVARACGGLGDGELSVQRGEEASELEAHTRRVERPVATGKLLQGAFEILDRFVVA